MKLKLAVMMAVASVSLVASAAPSVPASPKAYLVAGGQVAPGKVVLVKSKNCVAALWSVGDRDSAKSVASCMRV